jgi:ATP-dependent Clp protease adapter protein ClpS
MKTRKAMRKEIMENTMEMLDAAGFKQVTGYNRKEAHIGLGIHEMGTARMGNAAKTSLINKFNQMNACSKLNGFDLQSSCFRF